MVKIYIKNKWIVGVAVIVILSLVWMIAPYQFEGVREVEDYHFNFSDFREIMSYNITFADSIDGLTTGNGYIWIKTGKSRIKTLEICWHEVMHNVLDGTAEEEHEIIYSMIPNYFQKECLFIYGF